jgi:hypothetical protein
MIKPPGVDTLFRFLDTLLCFLDTLLMPPPPSREAERMAKCEAFAMGQLERLGAGSAVQGLEVGVVRMVLERV